MNKELIIIAIILVIAYLYWQNQQKTFPTKPAENNNQVQELKKQVNHYQSLYQKRVEKDLEAETLNSA